MKFLSLGEAAYVADVRQRLNLSPSSKSSNLKRYTQAGRQAGRHTHTHTLESVVCTHGWMSTRDDTLAAQAPCNVMFVWVMYMEPMCKKQIATTVQVCKTDECVCSNLDTTRGLSGLISEPQGAAMQVRRIDQVPLPTCIHSFV